MYDLQKSKPQKRFDEYINEDVYIIPCIVLEYGMYINNSAREVKIQRINFYTGEVITTTATTFEKSIEQFENLEMVPPFKTDCKVISKNFKIDYIVYGTGRFDIDFNNEFAELNIEERTLICKENYRELQEWVTENW